MNQAGDFLVQRSPKVPQLSLSSTQPLPNHVIFQHYRWKKIGTKRTHEDLKRTTYECDFVFGRHCHSQLSIEDRDGKRTAWIEGDHHAMPHTVLSDDEEIALVSSYFQQRKIRNDEEKLVSVEEERQKREEERRLQQQKKEEENERKGRKFPANMSQFLESSRSFLHVEVFPVVNYVTFSYLTRSSRIPELYIDTWKLPSLKMDLTVVLEKAFGAPLIVASLLSDTSSQLNFEKFFQSISERISSPPTRIFGPFKEEIRFAVQKAWPDTAYYGDSFHFLEENVEHLQSADTMVVMYLNRLWTSQTKEDFQSRLPLVLQKMETEPFNPSFKTYFEDVWLRLRKPEEWALYHRVEQNVRVESLQAAQMIEKYHRCLWDRILKEVKTVEELFQKLEKTEFQPLESVVTETDLFDQWGEYYRIEHTCFCGDRRVQRCSLQLCMKCCAARPEKCACWTHQREKFFAKKPLLASQVTEAVKTQKEITILYSGVATSFQTKVLTIVPIGWSSSAKFAFKARYLNTQVEEQFMLDEIQQLVG